LRDAVGQTLLARFDQRELALNRGRTVEILLSARPQSLKRFLDSGFQNPVVGCAGRSRRRVPHRPRLGEPARRSSRWRYRARSLDAQP
jgi:hypothetical protein